MPGAAPAFAVRLESWGDAAALLDDHGRVITYAELAKLADEFASRLDSEIHYLAVEATNSVEAVIAYLGALRAKVPVLLHGRTAEASRILEGCAPDAYFHIDGATGTWRLDLQPRRWARTPNPDLAVVLPTSGSTGSAKLVRLSASNIQANAESICEYLEITQTERTITCLPLAYSYGLSVLNSHLNAGASVVVTSHGVSTAEFRALLGTLAVTSLSGVPYSYDLMERCGLLRSLPRSIRTLTQAGGRMDPEMVGRVLARAEAANARLFVMYGQTEATARMAYVPPDCLYDHMDCIGRPIPGGELWVEDSDGARLPMGHEGALVYRGPNVMLGYAFSREDLALGAGPQVLRTGDLGIEVAPGMFKVTGRESRFVKPFGIRLSLDEIEARCGDAGAAVHVAGDDTLVVIASEKDCAAAVAGVVAKLNLPLDLFVTLTLPAVPRLAGGKIDYPAVLTLGRDARQTRTANGPDADPIGALFARLGRNRSPQDEDTFESLGGDSLNFVECTLAIEQALGELPEDWTRLPLGELRRRAAANGARPSPGMLTVGSDAAARAVAIMLIVIEHALHGLPIYRALGTLQGGAHLLLMLAGFSWARFQQPRLIEGKSAAVWRDFFLRYVAFYIVASAAVGVVVRIIVSKEPVFSYSLFYSSYGSHRIYVLRHFWFLENLSWFAAFLCVLFSAHRVRSWARRWPTALALALVGFALIAGVAGQRLPHSEDFKAPDQTLIFFAAGWAFATTRSRWIRAVLVGLLCAIALHYWGWRNSHPWILATAGALMVSVDRFSLPRWIAHPVLMVAGSTFYIYQVNIVPNYVARLLHWPQAWFWPFSIAFTLGLAFASKWLIERRSQLAKRALELKAGFLSAGSNMAAGRGIRRSE